jgi:hypothetical protein
MSAEYSVSSFNLYMAVMTVNFHYQYSMVNSSVNGKYVISKALTSRICIFVCFDPYMEICNISEFVPQNGFLTALPYVVMWLCSMGSGWLCDHLIMRGCLSTTAARKIFTTIGG